MNSNFEYTTRKIETIRVIIPDNILGSIEDPYNNVIELVIQGRGRGVRKTLSIREVESLRGDSKLLGF